MLPQRRHRRAPGLLQARAPPRRSAGLSAQSLVEVVDRDVRLTQRGLGVARSTLDKYEFFRRLLCDAGVDGRTASEEACRMEHCISDPSFRRLADHLVSLRGQGGGG